MMNDPSMSEVDCDYYDTSHFVDMNKTTRLLLRYVTDYDESCGLNWRLTNRFEGLLVFFI